MMTNQQAWSIYEKYIEPWKPISQEKRLELANSIISEDARYSSPILESGDRNSIIARMGAFQTQFPGGHIEIGDVSAHHDVALLTWIIVQADGTVFARGHDQMCVSPDGKIVSITTFAPPVRQP